MIEIRDMLGAVEMRAHNAVLKTCSEERHGGSEALSHTMVNLKDLQMVVYHGAQPISWHARAQLRERHDR